MVGTRFVGDTSVLNGGALYETSADNLTDDTFSADSSLGEGGTIFDEGDVTVTQSTFSNTSSWIDGGAVYVNVNHQLTMTNVSFKHDETLGDQPYEGGGSLYVSGSASLDDVQILGSSSIRRRVREVASTARTPAN